MAMKKTIVAVALLATAASTGVLAKKHTSTLNDLQWIKGLETQVPDGLLYIIDDVTGRYVDGSVDYDLTTVQEADLAADSLGKPVTFTAKRIDASADTSGDGKVQPGETNPSSDPDVAADWIISKAFYYGTPSDGSGDILFDSVVDTKVDGTTATYTAVAASAAESIVVTVEAPAPGNDTLGYDAYNSVYVELSLSASATF